MFVLVKIDAQQFGLVGVTTNQMVMIKVIFMTQIQLDAFGGVVALKAQIKVVDKHDESQQHSVTAHC